MLSVADARNLIVGAIHPRPTQSVPVTVALDAVLAADIVSPLSLPMWDNSAMDGYAVRSSDIVGATENNPIHLRVLASIPAGAAATTSLEPQTCIRIFTGAPIPPGADAVVMQEDTRPHHEGYVAIIESAGPGENIRRAGEDVQADSVVLPAGKTFGPAQLAMAAAVGLAMVPVHPPPRVGVLVTGAEVIEPGQPLRPGQIYDSNSVMLCALLQRAGCVPVDLGIADDTVKALREKMDYGLSKCDALITVGGVSVGEYDLVKDVLRELGCEQNFWKVAMKPGKPFVFGTRGPKPVFGLPGNPVSAFVTFLLLVRPGLQRLRGCRELELPVVEAEAGTDLVNRGDRPHYLRARLDQTAGRRVVTPLSPQGSHVISSLAQADCLVETPACKTIPRGNRVAAIVF